MRRGLIESVDEIRHFYQFTVAAQSSYPLSQSRSDPAKPQQPMEFLGFLVIGFLIAILVLPFVALAKANRAKRGVDDLVRRLSSLENELRNLRPQTVSAVQPEAPAAAPEPRVEAVPPPIPAMTPAPVVSKATPEPPPIPQELLKPSAPQIARPSKPPIDWEQFMGAKLFAWIGGLALFLGIAFFVKYSFEHNLIPPELRIAIGFVVGAGLVVGGLLLKRKENAVTAQTLCATGILVLYAVTFACRAYYHFAFFGLIPTFLLMTLITAVAFLLSVRLNAIVVAVLGIAGGFLTPILLSTNQDNPLGLFGYIALLDIGLLALAQRQRWNALPILGAIGTALMQFAWVGAFFVPEKYFAGNRVLIFMAVFVGFQALFLAAAAWAKRTDKANTTLFACAIGLAAVAMFSAFYLLGFHAVAHRPALLFTYLFVIDLGLLALTLIERKLASCPSPGGTRGIHFSRRMDGQLPDDRSHLYRAGILFRLRAVSCSNANSVATLAQDRGSAVDSHLSCARPSACADTDIPTHRAFTAGLAVRVNHRRSRNRSGDSDCDSAARHRRARAHTRRGRRVAAANSD